MEIETSSKKKEMNQSLISNGGSSYYHEIISDSTDFSDSMSQIVYYENTITQDFFFYMGLLWFGLSLSVGLAILNLLRHEGPWKAVTFIFELFCLYTWLVGIDAKSRLKIEVQRCFMICLAGMVIIKVAVSIMDCYTLMNWKSEFKENASEFLIENKMSKSTHVHLVFSFLQITLGGYIYYRGRRLMKLFIKRRAVILNEDKSISDGLAIL